MLKYSDLTQEQKDFICNGCGGKGSRVPVPNFLFKASCNQHDFYYWRGCTEEDRAFSDEEFYRFMKIDVEEQSDGLAQYLIAHMWAYIYYKAVGTSGKGYFSYNDRMKTIEDLELEMKEA